MMPIDATKESYELAEIDQRVVLFTNLRIDRNTIPKGLYCYDVRDSDHLDGSMAEVKPHILVNHWGTILSREPFKLNEWGSYYPKDWGYLNHTMTLSEFSAATKAQLTACLQQEPPIDALTMQ